MFNKNFVKIKTDILVLGTGIAGLSTALKLAQKYKVTVVSKKEALETNTRYAQGGIASVTSLRDDFRSHVNDTLKAGAGLCHKEVVEKIVEDGPQVIRELVDYGVHFTKLTHNNTIEPSPYALGKEGGHSHRRILHAGDTTGNEIAKVLLTQAQKNPRISILENHTAIDLITTKKPKPTCLGAYILDAKKNKIITIQSKATILATGGAGKVYLYTSNPDIATGDGFAMAYRAGATLANLEFVQFHPTCLYNPGAWAKAASSHEKSFLVTEALRGEGGILKLKKNEKPFMHKYHPLKDLAPRDIVARAIDAEMKKSGDDFVLLDISHKDPAFIKNRFPNIYKTCLGLGIDMTKKPIPVVPAAHYFCGGVKTDLNAKTDIENLFAIGEAAFTGLHGANRLASNSLLEAVAMGDFCSRYLLTHPLKSPQVSIPHWKSPKKFLEEGVLIAQNWDEVRRLMWNYVGIVRSNHRLNWALQRIKILQEEINYYYAHHKLSVDLIELRNVAFVAEMIIRCALARHESRGLHYTTDYPKLSSKPKDTYLQKNKGVFLK